jgi:hypothetical protein
MLNRKSQAVVAWATPPMFEYEVNVYDAGDLERLDLFINAKASQGWRVHTCQHVGDKRYFILFDRLLRKEDAR